MGVAVLDSGRGSSNNVRVPCLSFAAMPRVDAAMPEDKIPQSLVDALTQERLVPLVGSGMSLDVSYEHFPGWNKLFDKMVAVLHGDNKQAAAGIVENMAALNDVFGAADNAEKYLGKAGFRRIIQETFDHGELPEGASTELPNAIWALKPKLVITTNYDNILEWTNRKAAMCCNSDTAEIADLANKPTAERPRIWHLHGHVGRGDSLILSPQQYEGLYGSDAQPIPDDAAALDRLESLLTDRTLVFIGFGMRDEYVMKVIGRVLARFKGQTGKHYALMKAGEADQTKLWAGSNIEVVTYEDHGQPLIDLLCELSDRASGNGKAKEIAPPAPKVVDQPIEVSLSPLPKLDRTLIRKRFIGRERLLGRLEDLLRGLSERAKGERSSGTAAVQLQWVHGFGGMGKSWYARRVFMAAEDHETDIQIAMVDWDSEKWREPLIEPPHSARDLFEPIARRLAQLAGTDPLRPFRAGEKRVEAARGHHRRLVGRFEEQLDRLIREGSTDASMRMLLQDRHMLHEDAAKQKELIERLRSNWSERYGLFINWCEANGDGLDDWEAAVRPTHLLATGLVQALQAAARSKPLLLILDTCELVRRREELDFWLRQIVRPLCNDSAPALALIASRLKPDAGIAPGAKTGWQEEISDRLMDVVDFNADSTLLSRREIEGGLRSLDPPVEDTETAATLLHKVTLGVPLAVGTLFDMHRDDSDVLSELGEYGSDEHPLDESKAAQRVIEKVARRMLLHLDLKKRPHAEADLESIVALTLLTEPDQEVLSQLWPGTSVRERLFDLAGRYSLIAGADLHARVRAYLRRFWRGEERPSCFGSTLARIEQIVAGLPAPDEIRFGRQDWIRSRLRAINVQSWAQPAEAVDAAARLLAVSLTFDESVREVSELLHEIGPTTEDGRSLNKSLERLDDWTGGLALADERLRQWLRFCCNKLEWTEKERACLTLVEELTVKAADPDEAIEKYLRLEPAVRCLETGTLPRSADLSNAFFEIGYRIWPDDQRFEGLKRPHSIPWPDCVESAYELSIRLGNEGVHVWNNLGNLLQSHFDRYDEAEEAYRRATELDPTNAYPWNGLGNLLTDHLERYDEAEDAYRKAIEIAPKYAHPWNGLGNLLTDHLERYDEAKEAYRKVIELDPSYDSPRLNLAFLFRDTLQRPDRAREVLRELQHPESRRDVQALHEALFAAYDGDWEGVRVELWAALAEIGGALPTTNVDDWCRAPAVLLHLGFGEKLVGFLEAEGVDERLPDWFVAVRAHVPPQDRGDLDEATQPKALRMYKLIEKLRNGLPPR
jgi:tetratricopeptide (TPR) repeat protein